MGGSGTWGVSGVSVRGGYSLRGREAGWGSRVCGDRDSLTCPDHRTDYKEEIIYCLSPTTLMSTSAAQSFLSTYFRLSRVSEPRAWPRPPLFHSTRRVSCPPDPPVSGGSTGSTQRPAHRGSSPDRLVRLVGPWGPVFLGTGGQGFWVRAEVSMCGGCTLQSGLFHCPFKSCFCFGVFIFPMHIVSLWPLQYMCPPLPGEPSQAQ